jgi:hypothetical protein
VITDAGEGGGNACGSDVRRHVLILGVRALGLRSLLKMGESERRV